MEQNETPKTRWKTTALTLPDTYRPGTVEPINDPNLAIKETLRSVDMGDTEGQNQQPYGMPISAKLAVALIADFQKIILPIVEDLNSVKFTEPFDAATADTLKDLLIRSAAITIDKNVLLKTLSQPGCEGIRFYLCRKVIQFDDGTKESFVSLATVGVDAKGFDLHYHYQEGIADTGLLAADLPTTSLVSEYGSPPPPRTTSINIAEIFDEKFALLKYAIDEVKNIRMEEKK